MLQTLKNLFVGQPAAWGLALLAGGARVYYDHYQSAQSGSFGVDEAAAWNKAIKAKAKTDKKAES